MDMSKISAGKDLPHDFNVVIENPRTERPRPKYEVDKESGALLVDRFIGTSMRYPANYGFIPQTLGDDGDPVDVCVITPFPHCGRLRNPLPSALGMLLMEDESGGDMKMLAVPVQKLTPRYNKIQTIDDVPEDYLAQIRHFFEHYKDLEKGKWAKVSGWTGPEEACKVIMKGVEAYNNAK